MIMGPLDLFLEGEQPVLRVEGVRVKWDVGPVYKRHWGKPMTIHQMHPMQSLPSCSEDAS